MPAQVREGDGKRWCCRGRGGCAGRGRGRAGFTCSRHGGRGWAGKIASQPLGERGICLPADRRGGGEGTAARGQRLSQVSAGAGREGAMGEGPERGGSAAEPGTRCDTAGDRAGRATRCGGDSGHRGDTAATPRGKDGEGVCQSHLPPSLPSSRLLSLTHPLHGFHDQSQFIAGHLRAGSGGRSGARGGEEGAAARPERRSRGDRRRWRKARPDAVAAPSRAAPAAQTPVRAGAARLKGRRSCARSTGPALPAPSAAPAGPGLPRTAA